MNSISMTKRQVAELLKFISDVYPSFDLTQSRIDTWYALLKDQNPAVIMKNAERYVSTQKFPPTIADLKEVKVESRSNDFLKKLDQWERDAVGRKPGS